MDKNINLLKDQIETLEEDKVDKSSTYNKEIKQIIEALLFSSHEPLSLQKIKEIINVTYSVDGRFLKKLISEIKQDWKKERRGFQIDEIAYGYLLRTTKETSPFIELLHKDRRGEKLSKAAMEVLAIVAYKQPIIRSVIEKIRGVDCSGTLYSLAERGLVEVVGKLDVPGRPSQYGVTKQFLKHFGLKSVEELASKFAV